MRWAAARRYPNPRAAARQARLPAVGAVVRTPAGRPPRRRNRGCPSASRAG